MIVTCPNCSKRYMVNDVLLSKEGRQVRCITCRHVWWQTLDIPSPLRTPPLPGIPEVAMKMSPSSENQSSWLGWILIFTVFLSLISVFGLGRNFIVKKWPRTEWVYDLVGLKATLPGMGLSIINSTSQVHQDGAIEMIRLTGDIINTSDRVRPLSPLKISSIGEPTHPKCLENQGNACVLDHWEHRFSDNSLLPGEKIHFETEPRPKVEGTQHISVEF